jgi:hypothetical protein
MRAVATTEASAELMLMMEGLQKYVLEGKRGHWTGQPETGGVDIRWTMGLSNGGSCGCIGGMSNRG